MEIIKEIAVSFCCIIIVCQILLMLSPKDGFGKIFKYVVGLFLIAGILSQTKNLSPKLFNRKPFQEEAIRQERLEQEISEEILKINENYVYKIGTDNINIIVEASLKEIGIIPNKIVSEIEKNDEAGNLKPRLEVFLSKSYNSKERLIKSKIKKEIGEEPILCFEEDAN